MMPSLALQSPIGTHDSISYVGHSLLRALAELGHDPGLFPALGTPFDALQPVHLRALARGRQQRLRGPHRVDRLLVWNGYTQAPRILARSREAIVYWDSDTLSDNAARVLRRYDRVWGVSRFVAETIGRSGVASDVLSHGVWPDELHEWSPPPAGPVTFLHLGQVCYRKGTDLLLRAFQAAFAYTQADVKLVIKCWPSHAELAYRWIAEFALGDRRIEVDSQAVPRDQLGAYFQHAHAVVLPSRCEAFGLVGLEALAYGRCLIATDFSGPRDYLADDCIRVPAHAVVPAELYPGSAAECAVADLADALREVAADPDAAVRLGRAARERVLRDWTWLARLRRAGLGGGTDLKAAQRQVTCG